MNMESIRRAGWWAHILAGVELGRHPTNMELADGIVANGVPAAGPEANYVASRLIGQISAPEA